MRVRAIDAGGSVTRVARTKKEIFKVSSPCMEIAPSAPAKAHIIENKSLDFMFKKSPCEGLVGRRFVKAEAMNQYTGDVLVCDNQEVKVLQEVTYINILYSIAADCIRRGLNDQTFRIGICIPAAEYYDDVNDRVSDIKDGLAGDTAIYFPMLDKTVRFSVAKSDIAVTPEGVVAAFKYKGDRRFVLNTSVVVDVGYRSTDITIMVKFRPVGASAASRPIGGINLESAIQSQLERDNIFVSTDVVQAALTTNYILDGDDTLIDVSSYLEMAREEESDDYLSKAVEYASLDGIRVSKDDMRKAARLHYIMQGQTVVDITEYVHTAKGIFVDACFKAITDVANAKMMNVNDISNVLCVGRPFSGDLDDDYNMVNMLHSKFKEDVNMYSVPDAGTANVVEIVGLLGVESD